MLTGIVICGGKSTRMGTDKGLIVKDGKTWAELAYHKFYSLNIPIKISINTSQLEFYRKLFRLEDLVIDYVTIPGPLAGLLSVHKELGNTDILILACDMVDISVATVQNLVYIYNEKKNEFDFFAFTNEEGYEPMLGIYSCKGLQKINQSFEEGNLKKYSMKHILEIGNTFSILVDDKRKDEFKNYNYK